MESPPSSSTWSEAFILSDDSGLLLTSGSVSSGSMSGDSSGYPAIQPLELNDSYCEDDSLDGMSDIMCGENFNTLKKGLNWNELPLKCSPPIDPPPEFQDKPIIDGIRGFAERLVAKVITTAVREYIDIEMNRIRIESVQICMTRPAYCLNTKKCWTSDFLSFSPCHSGRPNSRCSLSSSRLSSSHNSLSVPTACRADDSSFITQAVSHDTLSCNQISDLYNVPFDSDVYAVPVDVVKPPLQPKRNYAKRKRRSTASCCREYNTRLLPYKKAVTKSERYSGLEISGKRHSVAGTASSNSEPIHMTLQEVRQYLQTLYSSSSDSSEHKENNTPTLKNVAVSNEKHTVEAKIVLTPKNQSSVSCLREKPKKNPFLINIKNKKIKDSCDTIGRQQVVQNGKGHEHKRCGRLFSLKQTLCNVFRVKRFMSPQHLRTEKNGSVKLESSRKTSLPEPDDHNTLTNRALPPLPGRVLVTDPQEETKGTDFATSIHKVKDYGWYWGPLSGEAAEKILSNEPDGSFIVRDSSDDHYIFSLTFKLNNCVRHVRIEHDQGNFSFGSCTKFKSQTIVEFIENAVEHSRSGRYLFFLHRRPVIGPVRVQLLHPVSRFKQIQSLQHMCRFVILKVVRRDLIPSLPLPRRIIDYLNTPHYYSEHLVDAEEPNELSRPPSVPDRTGEPQIAEADDDVFVTEDHSGPVGNYVVVPNGFRSNNNPVVLNVRQS